MEDQEILKLCETILDEEEECFLPLKKLVKLILEEKEQWEIDESSLENLLKKDPRFRVFSFDESEEYWDEEEDAIMEEEGFYRGPRVMLISRRPSKDDLFRMIEEKSQTALDSLKSAYGAKPHLSDEEENELLAIMLKTKELRDKIGDLKEIEE